MVDSINADTQLIAVRVWWQRYGWYVLAGILIIAGGYFSWTVSQDRQFATRTAASYGYQLFLQQVLEHNYSVPAQDNMLSTKLPAPYNYMQKLLAAQTAVKQQKLLQATTDLQQVLAVAPDPFIRGLATIRLARVYLAQGQAQQALDVLASTDIAIPDRAEWAMTRARALTLLQNYSAARSAYGEIVLLYPEYSPQREMALLWLADLPAD